MARCSWREYSDIRLLIDEYMQMQEGKEYDQFMRKLARILDL